MAKKKAAKKKVSAFPKAEKQSRVSQSDMPGHSLADAARIAQALWDNFAGKDEGPLQIAAALGVSPASSSWRTLTGSAIGYGITDGGYNAEKIRLTDLGRRLVSPLHEGDDSAARKDAALRPRILSEFLQRYNKAKFPKEDIAKNVLNSMGVPRERLDDAYEILFQNAQFAGLLIDTPTGKFVDLQGTSAPIVLGERASSGDNESLNTQAATLHAQLTQSFAPPQTEKVAAQAKSIERVFITHGKNKKILDQIKELVRFGQFEPIVAAERETVSQPVPDKVLEDMRSCQAAVIHVSSEGALLDQQGNQHQRINENVLIEIGAAMALYRRNFILLVEDGVKLPSNLQGLYECRYAGDELTMPATMKLLKAFNDFKTKNGL